MHKNPDMRGRIVFPPRPTTKEGIYGSTAAPWLMACSLAGKYDRWQVDTCRKLYRELADDMFYRDILDTTRVIFDESRSIGHPAAFPSAQMLLAMAGKEICR